MKLLEFIEKKEKISIPVIAVLLGLFLGVVILIISKHNPLDLFVSILRGSTGLNFSGRGRIFNSRNLGEFFVLMMPICLTGLSVGFSFRAGLFNIGAEGQLMLGSFVAVVVGLMLPPLPKIIHLPLVVIAGTVAGACWGFIPGILKALFNVHEVVVTIMLNYAALYLTNYGYQLLPLISRVKTELIGEHALLHSTFLTNLTNNSRLHWGIFIVMFAVLIYWVLMEKTTLGFELRATGYNRHAALYSGINVNKDLTVAMMISGGFAGLAGTVLAIGTFSYGRVLPGFENYGFDGIAVALVGNNHALGILLSAILFGSLKTAQPIMQSRGIPRDIISIIIAFIILFVAMRHGIRYLIHYLRTKNNNTKTLRTRTHPTKGDTS